MSNTEKTQKVSLDNDTGNESVGRNSLEAGVSAQQKVEDEFPDGGSRAWMVALGASVGLLATFGYANAFG
jgi:hypothetical protein